MSGTSPSISVRDSTAMAAIGILIFLIQIGFAVHAIKRDDWNWVFLILFIPLLGSILYAYFVFLPEVRATGTSRGMKLPARKSKLKVINFGNESYKQKFYQGEALLNKGRYAEAISHYEQSLTAENENDPHLMLALAKACFKNHDFQKSRTTLDKLISINPEFRSLEGHLLYARSLEELEDFSRAQEEYEALVSYNSSLEVLCAYAVFLKKKGDKDKARTYFKQILNDAKSLPKHKEDQLRKWINVARQELLNW